MHESINGLAANNLLLIQKITSPSIRRESACLHIQEADWHLRRLCNTDTTAVPYRLMHTWLTLNVV